MGFLAAIESVDWSRLDKHIPIDCNMLASSIYNIIVNKMDICFPLKKVFTSTDHEHWVDTEILNFKHLLYDMLHLQSVFPQNKYIIDFINELTAKYTSLINDKRTTFYSNQIRSDPNKSKRMWQIINAELGRKKRDRLDFTDIIRNADTLRYHTKLDVVNALNKEFVTAAIRCGAPSPDVCQAVAVLAIEIAPSDTSLRLTPFTPSEVKQIINRHISPKTSTDIYGLSASLLRIVSKPLAFILSCLYNRCLKQGTYPAALKKVKICPLFKGNGNKCDIKSYRPISLVPTLSKVLEVGLNSRLLAYITGHSSLSNKQYAYRPGRGTTDLVREVVWTVLRARERSLRVALVCCDLSRAFDTARHSIIASKLDFYGIRGPSLSIVSSFMSNRTQTVVGDNGHVSSLELENMMGVPQGSCLSNTLFSVLMNDLPDAIPNADIYMYADDVAAVVTAASDRQLEDELNSVIGRLDSWFRSNGLALNRDKTCFLTFNLNGRPQPAFRVKVGDTELRKKDSVKLLGFHIDSCLAWDVHIDRLCVGLGRACFALHRLAHTATRNVVRSCYFATVHSTLAYGVELWARAADSNRAFVMQKRAVRAIMGLTNDVSCRQYFRSLGILPLPCELIYRMAVFMYLNYDFFQERGINTTHALRSNKYPYRLIVPPHKLSKSERSVYVMGPSVYNRLPARIVAAPTIDIFKYRLKAWLLGHSFYSIDEFYLLPEV